MRPRVVRPAVSEAPSRAPEAASRTMAESTAVGSGDWMLWLRTDLTGAPELEKRPAAEEAEAEE